MKMSDVSYNSWPYWDLNSDPSVEQPVDSQYSGCTTWTILTSLYSLGEHPIENIISTNTRRIYCSVAYK
jgi:hypothetical protein